MRRPGSDTMEGEAESEEEAAAAASSAKEDMMKKSSNGWKLGSCKFKWRIGVLKVVTFGRKPVGDKAPLREITLRFHLWREKVEFP